MGSEKVLAIVQARLGSSRLPKKVMMDVAGEPMLIRVIRRVKAITGVDEVVLATTSAEQDRALLDMAADYQVPAYAGSEDDVLDRFYHTAKAFGAQTIVRVTGDCPLLDPEVSIRVLERFLLGDCDYASNTLKATFPDGLDTEVFSVQALTRAWQEATLKSEREHVTPFIWKNVDKFRTAN
ncbi:MAG: cytidylyltransferase domain-containing protein, partial [Blastocatellia bacterium]